MAQGLYGPTGLSGNITNTATATSDQATPTTVTTTTPVSYAPGLSIVKTVTSVGGVPGDGAVTSAGEVIQYNVAVTNTGDVTLTGLNVTDPLTGATLASGVTLTPGGVDNFATSYTVTQGDIDRAGAHSGTQIYVSNMSLANGYEMVTFTGSSNWGGGTEYTGQQDLTVNIGTSDNPAGHFNAYAWRVDVFNNINIGGNSIVYTLQSLGVPDSSDIAKLAAWGDAQLAAGPNALISAAVQADIWMHEYGVGLAAGTDQSLIAEINYIDTSVLPTLPAVAGFQIGGTNVQGLTVAQGLYVPNGFGSTSITNTATATSDETPTQSASATTTLTYAPGLSLVKTVSSVTDTNGDGLTDRGDVINYNVVVSNYGDTTLTGVTVTDPLTGATLATNQTLGIGASETLPTSYTVQPSDIDTNGTGVVVNTAYASSDETPTLSASASQAVTAPEGDLSIIKTDGVTSVIAGTSDTYTIVVSNNGPSAVVGAAVADVLPAGFTSDTYTSVASAGASGSTASGVGNIVDMVNLAPGSSITYTVTGTVAAGATGSLVNTATVTAPSGFTDTNLTNNSATDTDTITPQGDLSITKTDGVSSVVAGTSDTYTIVVSNNGPSAVVGAAMADVLPAGFTSDTYTSVASVGAAGNSASGSGNIADTVNLAPRSSITYTVTGTVAASATGNLVNTATVTAPSGFTDTNLTNNSATDTDTIATPAVSIQKLVSVDGGCTWQDANTATGPTILQGCGTSPQFEFIVKNTGSVTLTNLTLSDINDVTGNPVDLNGSAPGNNITIASLAAGKSYTTTITLPWVAGQQHDTGTITDT